MVRLGRVVLVFLAVVVIGRIQAESFHFVAVGDRTGRERAGVFEQVLQKVNLLNPAFVVSVGDSIEGYSEDVEAIHQQWDQFESMVSVLRMPLYRAIGNHDMTNETLAEIYRQRFGRSYYHLLYKNTLFLFVNTEDPFSNEPGQTQAKWDRVADGTFIESKRDEELIAFKERLRAEGFTDLAGIEAYNQQSRDFRDARISDEQVRYFKEVLERHTDVRWTFVVMHKRAYLQTNPPKNWLAIERMLSDRPYTVFSGHEHRYDYRVRHGREYINVPPAGGGQKYPPEALPGIFDGVLLVNMTDTGPVIAVVVMDGLYDRFDARTVKVVADDKETHIIRITKQE